MRFSTTATVLGLCIAAQSVAADEAHTGATNDGTGVTTNNQSTGHREEPKEVLQEIVVTAQKRSENLMDVPSSITVLGGKELENTVPQSLVDLNGTVPGVTITGGGTPGQAQITMRGINVSTAGGASLVGIYVDEVPLLTTTTTTTADLMPYDIERIEVLVGPQGTLYGTSTMGGLIKYVLKDPQLNEFSGRVGVIGDYVDHSDGVGGGVRGVVNIPLITDVLGIRLSAYDQRTQGFIHDYSPNMTVDNFGAYTQEGARLAALWKPNDKWTVKFGILWQRTDAANAAGGNALAGNAGGVIVNPTTFQPTFGEWGTSTYVPTPYLTDSRLFSLAVNGDLGFATLTSATALQTTHTFTRSDFTYSTSQWSSFITDFGPNPNVPNPIADSWTWNYGEKITQEIRLASSANQRFEWMLGAFYTHELTQGPTPTYAENPNGTLIQTTIPAFNPFFAANGFPTSYYEAALFGNDTWHFNDQLSLTTGVRYAYHHLTNNDAFWGGAFGLTQPGGSIPAGLPYTQDNPAVDVDTVSHQEVVTWMVSPEWHVTKDAMVYFRAATGYRQGGPTNIPPGSNVPASYKSDTLTNYELGTKQDLLNHRLTLTAAIYDVEWKDIQVNVIQPVTNFVYPGNGNGARSWGGDVGASYVPDEHWVFGTTLSYVDARLTADEPALGPYDSATGLPLDSVVKGARLPLSSRFSGAATVEYQQPLSTSSEFHAGASYKYATDQWTFLPGIQLAVLMRQPRPFDMYAGLRFNRVDTRLYVRNFFSSEPSVERLSFPLSSPYTFYAFPESLEYTPIQPRTVGLSVDVHL